MNILRQSLLALVVLSLSFPVFSQQAVESDSSTEPEVVDIGYTSVKTAFEELTNKTDAKVQQHDGWTVVTEVIDGQHVIWSFPPKAHRAYPTAIRRAIVEQDGTSRIEMKMLCQSLVLIECDILFEQFRELNSALIGKLQQKS